jgi:hypothetical protein
MTTMPWYTEGELTPWVSKNYFNPNSNPGVYSPEGKAKTASLGTNVSPTNASTFSIDNFAWNSQYGYLDYLGAEQVGGVVYYAGGPNGYLPQPGSDTPITMEALLQSTLNSYIKTPGEIYKLKQKLFDLNYLNGKEGQLSLSRGDDFDKFFISGLQEFLNEGSIKNLTAASQGKKPMTFQDWLELAPPFVSSTGGPGGGGGVDTRLMYQKFEPEDFEIPIDQLFQSTLGRGASQEELTDFITKLNAFAQENPQKTVTKISGSTASTTTTGGVSNQQIETRLREQALNTPGAEQYNKATKYLNYFMDALDSPVRLNQ